MNVLLDANIYDEDLLLRRPDITALGGYLRHVNHRLLIPDVTKREIDKHFAERANKEFSKLNSNYASQVGLIDISSIDIDSLETAFKNNFDSKLRYTPKTILDSNHIDLETVLSRSLSEQPPFRQSDKGMRDTILWLTLLKYLQDNPTQKVGLISGDKGDFGSKEGLLKKELREELKNLQLEDRVTYSKSLGDFLSSHANPISYIDEDFVYDAVEAAVEDRADDYNERDMDIDDSMMGPNYEVDYTDYAGFEISNLYIYDETEDQFIVYVEVYIYYDVQLSYDTREYVYNSYDDSYDLDINKERETSTATKSLELFITVDKATKEIVDTTEDYGPETLSLPLFPDESALTVGDS